MPIQTVDQFDLNEKRVFIRCDFNVPLNAAGEITDDLRLREALPTIRFALEKNARIILASHLGRPKGKPAPQFSLKPVADRLRELLDLPEILFSEHCVGDGLVKLTKGMAPQQVLLLENLRFDPGEESNNVEFSEMLAKLCDIYINDAFGTAHRAHASTVGITNFVKQKGCGFLIEKELQFLRPIIGNPKRPLVAILGGAKVSDKIPAIENLLKTVDKICVGGAMAYTFLKAQGVEVGSSKWEPRKIHTAKKILDRASTKGIPFLLPKDHVIVQKPEEGALSQNTEGVSIPKGWMGVDVGPKTLAEMKKTLANAKTVFWNGPLGIYEIEKFAQGTYSVARLLAESNAESVIGGGDSAAAVAACGVADKIAHISTGGGASLELIEGKKLPGLKALEI